MTVKAIPDGFRTVTPYLVASDAAGLIDFLKNASGAGELFSMARPDGGIMHAQVKVGDSIVMMSGASEQCPPMPVGLYLYVEDADGLYQRALAAGATSVMEPMDAFWGDRAGAVKDSFGNFWWIATHREDVPPDEIVRRAEAHAACGSSASRFELSGGGRAEGSTALPVPPRPQVAAAL